MEAADARVRMNLFLDKLVQFPAALYASARLQFKYMCLKLLVLMYCTLVMRFLCESTGITVHTQK